MPTLHDASLALRSTVLEARAGLVERDVLVELIVLSAVAGEHLLVIGPPGTAKSEAVRRVARTLGGRFFEYLLGRFTEPTEIFGPVDLRKLRDGLVETQTAGMLPEADIAFLDEVFLGSTAILNTLLALLNERTFRRGHTHVRAPLRVCVGASNRAPDDEALAAFADRFLVWVFVEPVGDSQLEALLEASWANAHPHEHAPRASLTHVDLLAQAARAADLTAVRPHFAHAVRRLRAAGIALTDRRIGKAQSLIAAAAVVAGRTAPTEADLWPIVYAIPSAEQQSLARTVLRDLLEKSESRTLTAAAEESSAGPEARAARLVASAEEVLARGPAAEDARGQDGWRSKLEGVAREIDSGFAPETMPEALRSIRSRIVALIGEAIG
jgi:MoxR-like ATPase